MSYKDWFDEKGNVRGDLDIHDRSIPCIWRFGFLHEFREPCFLCGYSGACIHMQPDVLKLEQAIVRHRKAYPRLYDGSIKTRDEYVKYVLGGGGNE